MARNFVILCDKLLEKIVQPENVSTPEADPAPVIAGHVLGTYASAKIAEQAMLAFACPGKHYIVEAKHWVPLNLEGI